MNPEIPLALLDANVLYPVSVRSFLLYLADFAIFKPKWTSQIQEEWIRNLLIKRADLSETDLHRNRDIMNAAFPDANIEAYEDVIGSIVLPDPDDRHVVAAAIKAGVGTIVTFNLKDFPAETLARLDIRAVHPDEFVLSLIKENEEKARRAFTNQVNASKKPPISEKDLLSILDKRGLVKSVRYLKTLMNLID